MLPELDSTISAPVEEAEIQHGVLSQLLRFSSRMSWCSLIALPVRGSKACEAPVEGRITRECGCRSGGLPLGRN